MSPNNRNTILVIDDEPAIAHLLERSLRPRYDVCVAEGALEGLSVLESEPIDLVLLDISLPGITGLELCRRIKSDVLLRHTPVVFVTGMGSVEDKVRGLHVGADDYLPKPFSMEELLARVEATIRKSQLSLEANPLSKLPGNGSIEREILKYIHAREPFSVLYADLNHFKAYNDYYGFLRGDNVIRTTARLLLEAADPRKNLVGHVGGDDFIIVSREDDPGALCRSFIQRFDEAAPYFYDERERIAKFIVTKDRLGRTQTFPLLSVAIGVVTSHVRPLRSVGEVASIGAEVKGAAKRLTGSAFFIDRRRTPHRPMVAQGSV